MPTQPNILFVFPDQHRYDWLGCNAKIPVRTPNIDQLAERGVRFTKAITPSPLCAPARACLASGREYVNCGVPTNRFNYPLDQPTMYRQLRDVGYYVMGCGKFDLHKGTLDWGLDGKRCLDEWGFSDGIDNEGKFDGMSSGRERPMGPYLQFLEERGLREVHVNDFMRRREQPELTDPTPLPDDAYCDNWVGRNAVDLLRRAPKGQPWFLQVNFTGPHNPWDITESMAEWYRDVDFPLPHASTQFTPAQHVAIRRNYAAMIENIDRWLGTLLNEVKARGELERTLVVFSSDHGEMLGDHDLWGKRAPYRGSVGVPLVIAGPGVTEGVVRQDPTTILDLTATFLDYGDAAPIEHMESRSLRPILEGSTDTHRAVVRSALEPWSLAFDGRYVFSRGYQGQDLLFEIDSDPEEIINLAASHVDHRKRLASELQ